jgi:hypothetical protein
VLLFWLTLLFVNVGLFAPRNAMVVVVMLVSALSLAGATVMILDLDQRFKGFIVISPKPMQDALAQMTR